MSMLDRFGIVGVSWRQDGADALVRFTLDQDTLAERLQAFAVDRGLAEIAYLETCNRVELIFLAGASVDDDLRGSAFELLTGCRPAPGEAVRALKAWRGEGACEHLFMVAAGLSSAAVGEPEIVGQVRQCHDVAKAHGLAGRGLGLLFEEAFKVAATVRERTGLGEGSMSLAELAVAHIDACLAEPAQSRLPVALVGVSAMTERAALSLAKGDIPFVVVSRTLAHAQALAVRFQAPALALAAFQASPPAVAAILAATGSKEPVIDGPVLHRLVAAARHRPPLCVDMGVPADIHAAACARLGVPRIGMNDLAEEAQRNRAARLKQAAQARSLVDDAVSEFRVRVADRLHGPLFAGLQAHYRDAAAAGVERLLKRLEHLSADDRNAIRQWAAAEAKRFAHLPTVGVRALLRDGPEGSLEAFLDGVGDKLGTSLRPPWARTKASPSTEHGAGGDRHAGNP